MDKIIFTTPFGSKLYGTWTSSSDLDFKSVYLNDPKRILSGTQLSHYSVNTNDSNSKNTQYDIDHEYYSLETFIKMAIAGETIALDMLHADCNNGFYVDPIWKFIHKNRSKFYTSNMKSYLGYVKKQAAKCGIKGSRVAALREVLGIVKTIENSQGLILKDVIHLLPNNEYCQYINDVEKNSQFYEVLGAKHQTSITLKSFEGVLQKNWDKFGHRAIAAENNQGIDWKSLHHAIRGGLQLKEIYETGDLVYPLKDREFLKQIKAGRLDFKEVSTFLEDLIEQVDILAEETEYPEQVDSEFWEEFIIKTNLQHIKGYFE